MKVGVWHSLAPFVFRYLKARMWVLCVSSTAEGQMPYYKEKRKRSARGKSVRSETDVKLTVTFNNMSLFLLRVSFVCLRVLPKSFGAYHEIQTNNKSETSAEL